MTATLDAAVNAAWERYANACAETLRAQVAYTPDWPQTFIDAGSALGVALFREEAAQKELRCAIRAALLAAAEAALTRCLVDESAVQSAIRASEGHSNATAHVIALGRESMMRARSAATDQPKETHQ